MLVAFGGVPPLPGEFLGGGCPLFGAVCRLIVRSCGVWIVIGGRLGATPSSWEGFPGQAPLWLDFGIWAAFSRGAFSLTDSLKDRPLPGQAPLWLDFGIWAAFPRGAFSLTDFFTDRLFPG